MLDQDKTKEQLIAELQNLGKLVEARSAELTALNNQLQHEIAQHKATQEALQRSESNFLSLVELSPDGIGIEQKGKVIFVNAVGVEMLGAQSPDQIIGKSLMDLVHPDYQEKVRDRIQKISNDKTQLPYIEEKLIRLDGGVIDVEAGSAACSFNNIPSAQVVFRDITKRKADEEALRLSEEQFRSVIETAHDAIITTDHQGIITSWNTTASRIYGYSAEEIVGQPVFKIIPKRFINTHQHKAQEVVSSASLAKPTRMADLAGLKKDGTEFPAELSVSFWESSAGTSATAIIRDISERKAAERNLLESEARFRNLAESATDAIVLVNDAGEIFFCNNSAALIFGYSKDEAVGMPLKNIVGPHDAHQQAFTRSQTNNSSSLAHKTFESQGMRKGGQLFPVELSVSFWKTLAGGVYGAIIRDITQRRLTEESLRRSEEQFRSLVETASDAIITTDLQGTIVTWNKGAETIYGYSADEIINKSFDVLLPGHFTIVNQIKMLELFAQHKIGIIFQDAPIPAKRKDGREFHAEGSVSKWESNEGIFLTALVRDVTDRKQAEEALRRSEIQYRSVIETASDAIVTTDSAGIIVGWNNGAEQTFGYSADEIMNKTYLTLMPERLHAKYLQRLKGFDENSNNVQRGESFGRRKDGSEFPAEGSLSMWKTDEGVFFTTTARDISDRKLAEDLINKVNNCLLSFTPDPDKNIQTIVETVGLILNADGAAYHKIASRYVTIKSQWNMQSSENSLPPIKEPNFRAMFAHNSDKACIYIPLHKQSFESKESSGMHYQFETSIAVPIKDYNTFMGTLNVSFKNKRILNQNEENALTILAKAIGTEEYRKRYLAKLIKNQRKLTAAKKRLDSFSQKILSIREEEKKSLSNNLHDEIGSMVVALSSCLTISKEEIIENNPDQALQRINQAETALRQSVDNLKKIVVDLRPPQFEIIGLSGILKELCTSFYHQTAIDLDCRFNIKDKHVSDNAAIAIYRVCQEALNNIVKHAKAKRVKIEINSEKRKITVSISDDGRGFDFRKYNDSYKGEIKLGLISMRERIEALGGTFIIESTQNQGTTIHATLPSR